MKFQGTNKFNQNISTVWYNLNNPDSIKLCINGCSEFLEISKNVYKAKININLGPVNANFSSDIKIKDIVDLKSYVIEANGSAGHLGFGKGTVKVELVEDGKDTLLNYSADTQISGKIAQLGARLIEGSVKKNTNSFFRNFELLLQKNKPVESSTDLKRSTLLSKTIKKHKYLFIFLSFFLILVFNFLKFYNE